MDFDDERLAALFGKAASGALTPGERAELDRWMSADRSGQRRLFVDALPGAFKLLDPGPTAAEPRLMITPPATPVFHVPAPRFAWVGASVVGIGVIAAALIVALGGRLTLRPSKTAQAPRVIETVAGQRAQVQLSDGTKVTLGPASRIEVPATFGDATRTVAMVGEVLFDVTHDVAHPFVVEAGNTRTEDLGTRFDVRAYPSDTLVRVVVDVGRVAVHAIAAAPRAAGVATPPIAILSAGELATVDRLGTGNVQHTVDPDEYLGWSDGCLVFRQASLSAVATEIARWYGVTVRVAGAPSSGGALTARWCSAPLDDVLGAVSVIMKVQYERRGDTVVVRSLSPADSRR
ncbi:MAG TPA: FecR domain-containing protein [Gemmatimonadaceae bacterium]|jgi:transmembrane sensor|nr:FecR domain-containing protein [Gemmatimonadaceae bacterium]